MQSRTSYEVILSYVTEPIRQAMLLVKPSLRERLSEIRIYNGGPTAFIYPDGVKFITQNGDLFGSLKNNNPLITTSEDIVKIVNSLCHYSLHSCTRELREGYFALEGGVRVGVSGAFSETADSILREFVSLNFRLARNAIGCADIIFSRTFGKSVLICGGVNSGKTTLLRDLCRLSGNICKVSLIDERNEISSTISGKPTNDVGTLTDILIGCKRADGIVRAIRTLSPDIIFCDEISTENDANAILQGFGCGVIFTATIHAVDFESLKSREISEKLLSAGVFDYAVFLEGSNSPSKIREIRRLKNNA